MSTLAVARRDFLDARRAKLVWAPAALYTLFMVLFFWGQSGSPNPDFHFTLLSLASLGGVLVVPLIALVAAYLAIAGERESGQIKFTLAVPVSRADVIVGKLLARSAVVVAGLALAFVVGLVTAWVLVPEMTVDYGDYGAFVALTLLYALAYVAVAVSISAVTASRSRAMGGAIGFFFLFNLVWNFLPVGPVQMVEFVIEQLGGDPGDYGNLLDLIYSLSPTGAYFNAMDLFVPSEVIQAFGGSPSTGVPFYLENWFMLVLLGLWVVVPLGLAYWRFRSAQLG